LKRVDETLGGTTPLEVVLKFPSTEVKTGTGSDRPRCRDVR
jgi:hypothetical protein